MTVKPQDPPRMFEVDEVPLELRRWLSLANEDALTPLQAEQLASSFEQRVHAGDIDLSKTPSGATPQQAYPRASGIRAWLRISAGKASVIAAILGVAAAGTLGVLRQRERAMVAAPRAVPTDAAPSGSAVAPPNSVVVAVPQATTSVERYSAGEHSAAARDSRAVTRQHAPQSTGSSAPRAAVANQSGSAAATVTTSEANAEGADEYRLVRAARQAASSDPARALALADEHLRQFPRGMLSQERETLAIEALARLGNRALAQKRADRFLAVFPTSPYAKRIQAAVGNAPRAVAP